MAFYEGSAYRLYVTKAGASNTTPLVGESTSTLNITADALETSDKSSPWKQYIAGMRGATISATLYADDNDGKQQMLLESLMAGEVVDITLTRYVNNATAGSIVGNYEGKAIITSIGLSMQNGGVATRDVSFQITGKLTFYMSPTSSTSEV